MLSPRWFVASSLCISVTAEARCLKLEAGEGASKETTEGQEVRVGVRDLCAKQRKRVLAG